MTDNQASRLYRASGGIDPAMISKLEGRQGGGPISDHFTDEDIKQLAEGLPGGDWQPFTRDRTVAVLSSETKSSGNKKEVIGWLGFDSSDFPLSQQKAIAKAVARLPDLLAALLTTRKELKEARERLAVVADDALEYALEARNAVIDDNRPRYQRQRDAIDADLAKFRAIIDAQPEPQALPVAGEPSLDSLIAQLETTHDALQQLVPQIEEHNRRESTLTARISELEGALKAETLGIIGQALKSALYSHPDGDNLRSTALELLDQIAREALHK